MNAYYAADMDREAVEREEALVDYIRDMGPVDECAAWCLFRDAFGLCGYRWPDCKLNRMRKEAP